MDENPNQARQAEFTPLRDRKPARLAAELVGASVFLAITLYWLGLGALGIAYVIGTLVSLVVAFRLDDRLGWVVTLGLAAIGLWILLGT
jgi:hypothetical protein